MINKKEIEITKHALDRLLERVLPMVKGEHKEFLSNPINANRALYSLVNISSDSLTEVEDKVSEKGGIFYDTDFESFDGVIPLRVLIRDYSLITIWPLGGWKRIINTQSH